MKLHGTSRIILAIAVIASLSFITLTGAQGDERAPANQGSIYMEPDQNEELTGSGYPIREGLPGDEILFRIWVVNDHSLAQTVVMELTSPREWAVTVTGSVEVPSGNRTRITVAVSVPSSMRMDPQADYSIKVEGAANITGDRASMIVIVRMDADVDHELVISPYNDKEMETKVFPGQRTYVDIVVTNEGDIIDDIDLRILDPQTNWEFVFREDSDKLFITLPTDESSSIFRTRLLVEVPSSADIGEIRSVTLESTSNLSSEYEVGKLNDRVTIQFQVVPPSTLSIEPESTFSEVETGETIEMQMQISLSGMMGSDYHPEIRVHSGAFEQSGWEKSVSLMGPDHFEPGEKRSVLLYLTPPRGIAGRFEVTMGGEAGSATIVEGRFTVIITAASNISFTELNVGDAKLGSNIDIMFQVTNNGDSPKQLVIDIEELPTCFIPEMEPSNFVLGSGRSRDVHLILHPKSEDVPLEFQFGVNIKVPLEDETEWTMVTEMEVPVRITELPNAAVTDIELPNRPIDEGENIDFNVTVTNPSSLPVFGFTVEIYEITWSFSNVFITSRTLDLDAGKEITLEFNWTARPSARKLRAVLVAPEYTEETDTTDNDLTEAINVRPKSNIDGGLDGDEAGGRVSTATAIGAVVGGSVILSSLMLFVNTDLFRYPFWTAIWPLYSKLKPEHLLSNRLRRRIYVYVQNNPGEHFRGILVNLNLTNGTLAHHLYTLEKEDLIRSQRDGLYRRFYPAGYHIEKDRISLSPIQKSIMEMIRAEPGHSQKEIAEALSLSNSTVNYNIKSLKEKGVIEIIKKGKSTHIYPERDINS